MGYTENKKILRKIKKAAEKETPDEPQKKKMTGPMFWIILILIFLDEGLDAISGLSGLLGILASISNFIITPIVLLYLFLEGVPWDTRKIVTWILGFIIETIPYLSAITPTYTLIFILTRIWVNNESLLAKSILNRKNVLRNKK